MCVVCVCVLPVGPLQGDQKHPTRSGMIPGSWQHRMKLQLFLKASKAYYVLSDAATNLLKYGRALRYIKLSLQCYGKIKSVIHQKHREMFTRLLLTLNFISASDLNPFYLKYSSNISKGSIVMKRHINSTFVSLLPCFPVLFLPDAYCSVSGTLHPQVLQFHSQCLSLCGDIQLMLAQNANNRAAYLEEYSYQTKEDQEILHSLHRESSCQGESLKRDNPTNRKAHNGWLSCFMY